MAERRLTIAQVIEKTSFATGSVVQAFEAARGLAGRGHRVLLVSRADEAMRARCAAAGIDYVALPFRHEFDLRSMVRLTRLVREDRIDVVHVHKGIAHAVALGASFLGARFGFVVNRGVPFPLGPLTAPKFRSRRVHRIVVVSQQLREIVARSGRIPLAKISVIHAGVDTERFDPTVTDPLRVRTELGIDPGSPLIGVVGIRPEKGWVTVVDAFAAIRRAVPAAHLLLVGCGSESIRRDVLARTTAAGFASAVTVTLARDDMPDVLAACSVLVDPSLAAGITGTLREALAVGVPVVASRVGGNPELVTDHETGLLVDPGDPERLAAAIVWVLSNRAEAANLAARGQARVRARFSTAARVERLEELYRAIVVESSRT